MHPTEIPPWLRKILDESQDPDVCMKAIRCVVMPVWRETHPRLRNSPGPRKLGLFEVGDAVEIVLGGLTPAGRKTITWKWFLSKVQQTLGDSPNKGKHGEPRLYHETVLRPLIWVYILTALEWDDIPPQLFARRQPWMPADRSSFHALRKTFRRERNRSDYRLLRILKTEVKGIVKGTRVTFTRRDGKIDSLTIVIPRP